MFNRVFEGVDFSYFYDNQSNRYTLYWRKYEVSIILKDEDADLFRKHIEIISGEPDNDVKAKIEKAIQIQFYFKFSCPMPHFVEK